jgi:hypothetical protein
VFAAIENGIYTDRMVITDMEEIDRELAALRHLLSVHLAPWPVCTHGFDGKQEICPECRWQRDGRLMVAVHECKEVVR